MANVIKQGGLRLINAGVEQPLMWCVHASGDSVILGVGDAVKTAGDSAQIGNGPYTKTVTRVASGDPIYGVVESVFPLFSSGSQNLSIRHCPASTGMYVLVRPAHHSDVYTITEDGTMGTTNIGDNANLTGNGGGTTITDCNTSTGMSTMMLDSSTAATTATLQLKTVGYLDSADNTPSSANSQVLVQLNNIENSGGTGTAGV